MLIRCSSSLFNDDYCLRGQGGLFSTEEQKDQTKIINNTLFKVGLVVKKRLNELDYKIGTGFQLNKFGLAC
jgi:hypothetical protein